MQEKWKDLFRKSFWGIILSLVKHTHFYSQKDDSCQIWITFYGRKEEKFSILANFHI
jgi:hypothetical protein